MGTPPPIRTGWGYTPPIRTGWVSPPPPWETEQQSKYLLRGERYASCVNAGGFSCFSQIFNLREELQEKDRELQKKDNDLYLAGKFGNELLETNSSLNKLLVTLTQETNRKIEVFINFELGVRKSIK